MRIEMQLGNATLRVLCDEYNQQEEYGDVGGGTAEVSAREYVRLRKEWGFEGYAVENVEDIEQLITDDENATVSLSNDDLIVFLNAGMHMAPATYEIDFAGLSFWFLHDTVHAENDVDGGSVYVDETIENRTLYKGAILAAKHGVPLSTIVRELSAAETTYRKRWEDKMEPDALEKFLERCEFSIRD